MSPEANVLYGAINLAVLANVPRAAVRVLDLGCGTGSLGMAIKSRQGSWVTGVTYSEEEALIARRRIDEVVVADLESYEPLGKALFDCIVCSHVLEHLRRPDDLLKKLARVSRPRTALIVALPNVLHWRQRLEFMKGRFNYSDGGLMDRTHYRFFDWETAKDMVESSGWGVDSRLAQGHFPGLWRVPALGTWLDKQACELLPGTFGEQFVLRCVPRGRGFSSSEDNRP